ncbi:MAG: NAD(P)-dependent oxidoreductase [Salinirussus sp.]
MTLQVGVIGLGNMGSVLAKRLVDDGCEVIGFDLDTGALEAATEHGVVAADSVADVATRSEVILTSLPDPDTVDAVYRGEDGILANAEAGSVALETSTIDPHTTQDLEEVARGHGVALLDAPVSGGVGRAERGTLTVMVGGDEATFEEERVQRVLRAFGADLIHGGDIGAGHTLKLINNVISASTAAASLEGAALASEIGVDWEAFCEAVGTSSGASYSFKKKVPRALNRNFDANFTLNMGLKDTRLALEMARAYDLPTPMADAAHQLRTAGVKRGYGEEGSQAVIKIFEQYTEQLVEAPGGIDEDILAWEEKG